MAEHDSNPFVLLPGLTVEEARQVRDCIRFAIDHQPTVTRNLWPLHTVFAEAVMNANIGSTGNIED